jgi:Flp pilus assembly protein TadG
MIGKVINKRIGLKTDERGAALTEFALISPVFMLILMGVFDIGYGMYAKSILQGSVEAAGRVASLENTTTSQIDQKVRDSVESLNSTGNLTFEREYYQNYLDISTPEDFTDGNGNTVRDAGECFIDRNGNSTWDQDVGVSGRGGAQDVVVYTATLTYDRLFPIWGMLGQSTSQKLTGVTYLRNQPFSAQAARVGVKIC